MADVPRLVEVQEKWAKLDLQVFGVTDAGPEAARDFAQAHGVTYAIRANGAALRESYGVSMVWGTVSYLINPAGEVVATNIDDFEAVLSKVKDPA